MVTKGRYLVLLRDLRSELKQNATTLKMSAARRNMKCRLAFLK